MESVQVPGTGLVVPTDKKIDIAYFANDGRQSRKTKQNATFVYNIPHQVWLRSLKPIRSGQEILVDYGDGYWEARKLMEQGHPLF